jgi:hypothetical protein
VGSSLRWSYSFYFFPYLLATTTSSTTATTAKLGIVSLSDYTALYT